MKKAIITGFSLLSTLGLIGCGNNTVQPTTTVTTNATAATPNNDTSTTPASSTGSTQTQPTLKLQHIDLTVLPGGKLGPDGKMHDTFSPADFQVVQGAPVQLTIYNYDSGEHSLTSTALGLNVIAKGSPKDGVAGITTYTFTPTKAGDFTWQCMIACDTEAQAWAMSHDGYMMGKISVVPANNQQFIDLTIKDGLKYAAADGKLHDSYSPADFTVQAGIPVTLTVYNYDTGEHSFTSPALNVNQVMKGATKEGVPSVTTFTFTPEKAGQYHWQCVIACDGGPTGWAMSHDGYMNGTVTVVD